MKTDNYQEFNDRIFNEFKDMIPEELLEEMTKWCGSLEEKVNEIGADKIREGSDAGWALNESDDPHFEHHINQVKKHYI
jgi:hypothetical protein